MKIILIKLTDNLTGVEYIPPIPVDISDLYNVDHQRGVVMQRNLTVADIRDKWRGLPDVLVNRHPGEFSMEVAIEYQSLGGQTVTKPQQPLVRSVCQVAIVPPLYTRTTREEHATYNPDPEGLGRFGWRRPGMHVQKPIHPDTALTHGPGKRKKTKRK